MHCLGAPNGASQTATFVVGKLLYLIEAHLGKMAKLKFAKKIIFSSRLIIQVLLFAIFLFLFALPAIRTYQKREVGFVQIYFLQQSFCCKDKLPIQFTTLMDLVKYPLILLSQLTQAFARSFERMHRYIRYIINWRATVDNSHFEKLTGFLQPIKMSKWVLH